MKTFLIIQIERHQQLLSVISMFVHFTSFCTCLCLSAVYKAGFFTHFHFLSQFFLPRREKTNRKSINVTDEFLVFFSGMSSYSKWNGRILLLLFTAAVTGAADPPQITERNTTFGSTVRLCGEDAAEAGRL